ncbi:CpeT/CpcT family DUF1001 domain containing protein [Nitzschia inconspicua]|uniref:CpeT/CpcT family DUF1001 domain containing protein n=1 Tax=Nitzschia inconspicua TaxID=303405 RepID=A0A9K3Q6E4_9STRA|nr:CpeT/CpcT family DUF1001 domain containing protein [Nitzschia inconspicua]
MIWKIFVFVVLSTRRSSSFFLPFPPKAISKSPPSTAGKANRRDAYYAGIVRLHASLSAQDQILQYLKEWFQGDFDNYQQVVEDRKLKMEPREGGGHEHFHCTLVPLTPSSRLAAFYFDANPNRIFRFRHYQLLYNETQKPFVVEMQLSTLHPELEQLLRINSNDPLSWPRVFDEFHPDDDSNQNKLELLPKCEVAWSLDWDPIQHAYTLDIPEHTSGLHSLHAVMVYGEAIVNSTIVPGMAIRILDQLSLYPNVFYINDRGFDPFTGAYIYGNQRGVPYRLCRVSNILESSKNSTNTTSTAPSLQRHVENEDLAWTLGPEWRTDEEYQLNMEAIGGISAGINKQSYKSKMTKEMSEKGVMDVASFPKTC